MNVLFVTGAEYRGITVYSSGFSVGFSCNLLALVNVAKRQPDNKGCLYFLPIRAKYRRITVYSSGFSVGFSPYSPAVVNVAKRQPDNKGWLYFLPRRVKYRRITVYSTCFSSSSPGLGGCCKMSSIRPNSRASWGDMNLSRSMLKVKQKIKTG